jgi:hypothetical protein
MRKELENINRLEWNEAHLQVIWAFVQVYQTATQPFLKKKLKEALKRTIYKWTDLPPRFVSTEILRMFKESCIDKDPFTMIYPDRKALGRDENGKTIMLWEHTTTNHETYQSFVKCKSIEALKEQMDQHTGVCWITREEDTRLNKSGFRSSRKEGWRKAYQDCKINVIETYL